MKQQWCCEKCRAQGSTTIARGTDVYTVFRKLEEAHRRKSVICDGINKMRWLRVRAPGCTAKEWTAVKRGEKQ